jgi:alpha-galactosidase
VENKCETAVKLNRVMSLSLDIKDGDLDWIHFYGRHTMERQPERRELVHGIQQNGSTRGTSSHHQNPTVLLCDKTATEDNGCCFGAALMYSGGFMTQIEKDQLDLARVVMGINPDTFCWNLNAGETFYAPEVIMSVSTSGFTKLSQNFHKIIREHVCRGKYKLIERPVLINNWEATYFDFNEEKILNIAKEAARLGVDMLVLDDGWFGKRDSDFSGLGDWFVNENKLKGGLGGLVKQVNDLGMKFGLWFEPEMISEDSDLYREHPDWAIQIPGRRPNRSRSQLVLDITRREVRDYLYDRISAILDSANIEYVKWDMNRSIADWYSHCLKAENMGEMPHRYVLSLYELLERLTTAYPDVLWEGCSGGGGRFDAGMLYYHPQIWCSDDTDAYERTKIQYGTSFFYPVSAVGSHVSAVPNHQTGRSTLLETRGVTAMAGSFGYELDLNNLSDEEKAQVTGQIEHFKSYGPLIHNGDYYRLTNPMQDNVAVWSFVSEDKKQVLINGVMFRTEPNMIRYTVKLKGLIPEAEYTLQTTGETFTGAALMSGGILLPRPWGDYTPIELHFVINA